MNIYTPTYLYIKQHSITKKLYFGKTTKDPEKYQGSGTHWTSHIKFHGKEHVETLWYCLFYDKENISEFALMFSEQHNIVESKEWLNKIPENGLDGWCPGVTRADESKQKMSFASKGKPKSNEHKLKMSIAKLGILRQPLSDETKLKISIAHDGKSQKPHSKETKLKISIAQKGVPKPKHECPHCRTLLDAGNLARYHGDKCKHNTKL